MFCKIVYFQVLQLRPSGNFHSEGLQKVEGWAKTLIEISSLATISKELGTLIRSHLKLRGRLANK